MTDFVGFSSKRSFEYEEWYGQPHRAPDLQVGLLSSSITQGSSLSRSTLNQYCTLSTYTIDFDVVIHFIKSYVANS